MEKKHQNNKKHVTYADEYSDTDDSEDCSEDHKLLSYERKNKNKIKNSKQCLDSLNDQDENKQDTEQEDVPGSFIKQNQLTELSNGTYWLTRIVLLRYMGFIYFVAFMVSLYQNKALIGKTGLLPAQTYLKEISRRSPSFFDQIQSVPTIFWLFDYRKNIDGLLYYTSLSGALLSAWLIITGAANMILMFVLWILYHSIVNVGQRWYSFGWESQALETGFLCIFLCPLLAVRTVPKGTPTSRVFILALLWLIIRIMLGAGLIKIRGDKCWWPDLNCMAYHYETQPVPNPFSYYLHGTPLWFHKFEVLINHFVELIAPFLLIVPIRRVRIFGGIIQIAFQATLIFSGNLSFLNWLTILPSLAVFDDTSLSRLFSPSRGSPRWHVRQMQLEQQRVGKLDPTWTQAFRTMFNLGIGAIIAYLSIPIVQNLLSTRQVMNTSFDSFRIVNTYGAFGSITKQRTEIILQGTTSDDPTSFNAEWKEYEFHCKPGNVHRMPCLISPYHYRLDWLMWFAAFQNYQQNPWILHLTAKLLVNDRETLTLINHNPFNKTEPPKFIRAEHYRYSFSKFLSTDYKTGAWWTRSRIGSYFPPVSLESLKDTIVGMGWKMPRVKKTYSHQKPEKTEF